MTGNLSFCKNKFGSLVRLFLAWLVAFHVFPARVREIVERLLLIRQRRVRFRRNSGLKSVRKLKLTTNMRVHLQGNMSTA